MNGHSAYHQRGAVLVVSLLILLVMTLIGVAGIGTSSLEEKMAANHRDRELAFQAAEYALREGERFVQESTLDGTNFDASCTNGLCLVAGCTADLDTCERPSGTVEVWRDTTLDVWDTGSRHKTYQHTNTDIRTPPKYIIEWMDYVPPEGTTPPYSAGPGDPIMFRITALGTGGSSNARVMLQSTYQKSP